MEDARAAHRRRVEARAIGRTPEEHLALERALARRRQRQSSHASPVSHPVQRYQHPSHVEGQDDRNARFQPLDTCNSQSSVEGHREVSPPTEVPEYLDEIDDWEIYSIYQILHSETEPPYGSPTWFFYFDYAMFRAKVVTAKSAATLPALGIPPGRKSKPTYSPRNVRGAGWHRRGYRDHGNMWINVKAGSYGYRRGMNVYENEGLADFVRTVFHGRATKYPEGWYWDLFFKRKSLTRLLVDLENHGLDMDLILVKDFFDGGETVYFKLFDEGDKQLDQRYPIPFW
ncbi:hypothetical protein NPX13_g2081 [Xylaria arbuscula]|uniref:Uncharacterized protein n=1 Tax=Xylaria arbuscula TaxID=114810 RepID=A0A9W8NKT8_9PEZI|nr:hypothetical protein NPX13_g2081 [Xylaria arbuscula]